MSTQLNILPFSELMKGSPEIDWAIEGIAPSVGIGFIAGKFSVGKSWITQSLVLSVATGKKWLGHFPVKQGTVLVIDEENAQPLLTARFHKLTKGMGIKNYNLPLFYSIKSRMNFSLDSKGKPAPAYELLWEWVAKNKPSLILGDSLTRLHKSIEDKSYEMSPVFENVDRLCQAFDCMTLFTHHAPHNGERMRGSIDIYGASEWSLFVNKTGKPPNEKITISQDRARWNEPIMPFSVNMKSDKDTFRVSYVGECESDIDSVSQSILEAVKTKPLGHSEIMSKIGISQATFYRKKASLIASGLIAEHKIGNHILISSLNGK